MPKTETATFYGRPVTIQALLSFEGYEQEIFDIEALNSPPSHFLYPSRAKVNSVLHTNVSPLFPFGPGVAV